MDAKNLMNQINEIDGVILTGVNFGMGIENRIKMKITNEEDYSKWMYFIKRLKQSKCDVKIHIDLPNMTFLFPQFRGDMERAVSDFQDVLARKFYLIEEPIEEHMTIIAKVTNLCNIDCQYCYDKPFRKRLGHNKIIKAERLERAIRLAAEYAKKVTILWHGGEPTLAGCDYYRNIYENVIPKYPYADFEIGIQTNGTMLNQDWWDLAKEYNMDIGSSYNATQTDLRHTTDDNELGDEKHTIHNTLENIKNTQKANVPIGIIDVMTKENHGRIKEIYEFYKKEGIHACFNEIHNSGEAEKHDFLFIGDAHKVYEETTTDYFTYWVNDQSPECYMDRYASEHIAILLANASTVCHNGGRCVRFWIGLNSNGDIYPCDRALADDKYRIGNVQEFDSMLDIYDSPKYLNYQNERHTKLTEVCAKCNVFEYCHGGCPMEDIDESNSAAVPNTYACLMKKTNLMCAYKALLNTTIDTCNRHVRQFIIDNCLFLPKEIPVLIEKLGLTESIGELDFSEKTANLNSKEFQIFRAFNPTDVCNALVSSRNEMYEVCECTCEDKRFEIAIEKLKERAESLEEMLKEEQSVKKQRED